MAVADLTVERLRELLHYDPETGLFTWRMHRRGHPIGSVAGSLSPEGYIVIMVDKSMCSAGRLAWLYVHGVWPKGQIDHRYGIKTDNRISELRDISPALNSQNKRRPRSGSISGLLGVSIDHGLWRAGITSHSVRYYLGHFKHKHEAHAAYLEAKRALHASCTI